MDSLREAGLRLEWEGFWHGTGLLPLADEVGSALLARYPGLEVAVQKTQVTFRGRRTFCILSRPRRRADEGRLLLTFGLRRRLNHPRIFQAVEPRPNRWTHHLFLSSAGELDGELFSWLDEARTLAG